MSSSSSSESDSQRSESSEEVEVVQLSDAKLKAESTQKTPKNETKDKEDVEMKEYKAEIVVDAGTGESKTKVEIDEEVDPHFQEHGRKIKVPIWKKFKKKQHETQWEIYPRVHLNNPAKNDEKDFPSNKISTTKYSLLTFIPANLLQQFTHAINIYFLAITIITTIPQISPLNPITSIVPLLFVLVVNAIKEAVEDYNRFRADKVTNSRKFTIVDASGERQVTSEELKVGQILKLKKEESCPADAVLLATALPGGLCYVETAQLDGETNLKIFNAPLDVAKMSQERLLSLQAWFESKVPDVNLYKFIGKMVIVGENDKKKQISLEAKNLLLRGCKLKNTEWVLAGIGFTGKDTKLSLNQKNPPFKSSTVERMMNKLVAALFGWMVVCTIIMCVLGAVFQIGQPARVYLLDNDSASFILLKGFFSYLILFSFLIPQSMMVTLEIVKVLQTKLMDWDENMRTDKSDVSTGMNAKTSNLNDELGLVKYIFSDKTGTLTQNKMEFARSSVRGKEFSSPIEGELSGFLEKNDWKPSKPDGNPMFCSVGTEKAGDVDYMLEYLFCLAICHTAVATLDEASGEMRFEAQSPDEVALCNCAKKNMFQFIKSESAVTHVKVFDMEYEFKVLNCAEFTSERARMSIIVQGPDGKIKMYMKGADSVMLKRINMANDINKTLVQQTIKQLDKFSVEGLRTLVLGVKELSQKEFDIWHEEFHAANTSLKDREGLVKAAYEKIEKDMDLIGCTAIEDKLQDGVPDAIDYLLKAGTKVWVITGDKQETAINIGKSTKLLKTDQPLVVINVHDKDEAGNSVKEEIVSKECEDFLKQGIKTYQGTNQNPGLVINGTSLTFALNDWPELFLELSSMCSSVVCCRVTPFQKASIVRLVKTSKKEICLAIGDGANDVSMIQEAHIGIGIFGREGTQAARASDYAIQQFSHLKRLLVVHGRYSYVRNTTLVETSLYKNLSYFFAQFWFAIFCGFSGVTVVDDYLVTFYNILFTSGPPFFIGLQEKDIAERAIEKNPRVYEPLRKTYTYWGVFISQLSAVWHSLVFFGVAILIFNSDRLVPEGYSAGIESFGTYIATYAIATTLLRISLVTKHWTAITIFFNVLSMAVFWLVVIVISSILGLYPVAFGMMNIVFVQPAYWLGLLIALFFSLFPDVMFFVIQRTFFPTARQILQEEYFENKKKRSDTVDLIPPEEVKA